MGRKSSIEKLKPEVKAYIERLLRDNRLTLNEMLADVRAKFPEDAKTSRAALGRFRQGFEQVMETQKAMASASAALVAELGENFDDKSGALLAQAVTTLVTKASFRQLEKDSDDLEIGDVLDLARAAKSAQEARSLSLKERQAVAKEARERLLEEQAEQLKQVAKAKGVSDDTLRSIREALGIVA